MGFYSFIFVTMAQRRMFSPDIVCSDAFIEMPISAQVLYFHLGMRADDDGFVNPQITMRMVNANPDDLRVLVSKRFVLPFENGVIVIKHWRINNFIRRDRYKETVYIEQKSLLRVKENQAFTFDENQGLPIDSVSWKNDEDSRLNHGQPLRNTLVNPGKVRLGKVRLSNIYTSSFTQFWEKYPKKVGKKQAYEQWKKLDPSDHEKILSDIPNRKNDEKWINGFIKDPERYLKHRQWEDEIIQPRAKEGAMEIHRY